MVNVIVVDKTGSVKIKNIKDSSDDKIYKACGLKNNNNFENVHTYEKLGNSYTVYAKTSGRANNENKYELPPPIDNELYFGSLCIVKYCDDEVVDITTSEWNKVYESLYGGFEDIGDEDSVLSEDSYHSDEEYTKNGYLKDGFVVDDDTNSGEEETDESFDEEEFDNNKSDHYQIVDIEKMNDKINSKIRSLMKKHNINYNEMTFNVNDFIDTSDEED